MGETEFARRRRRPRQQQAVVNRIILERTIAKRFSNLQTIETRLRTLTIASIGPAAAAFLVALLALILVAFR